MQQKIEITFPKELIRELEIFTKEERITINEFIFWSIGEKIGEIRTGRGVKNLQQKQNKHDPQINQKSYSPNQLLRASEVAKYLDISKPEAYKLIRTKEFPVIRIGRLVRVRFSDLENYIDTIRK
jgi:excisionase family DNA binding protein